MIWYVPCGRFYPSRTGTQPAERRSRDDIESSSCPSRSSRRADASRAADRASAPRRRVSVVGVLGELLLTAGALILLFLGWQLWWNDAIMAGQQSAAASELSRSGSSEGKAARGRRRRRPTTPRLRRPGRRPAATATASAFAVLYVPRFGADYAAHDRRGHRPETC